MHIPLSEIAVVWLTTTGSYSWSHETRTGIEGWYRGQCNVTASPAVTVIWLFSSFWGSLNAEIAISQYDTIILNRSVFRIFGCSNADDICFIRAMTNLACIEDIAHYRHLMFLGRFASSVPWASAIVHTLEFWWYISVLVLSANSTTSLLDVYYCAVFISFSLGVA